MAEVERGVPVIVEIPKRSRNNCEFDHRTHRARLDRRLFSPAHYSADSGFVPDTPAEDGDPIDTLVLLGEPTFPGCLIRTRIVGLLRTTDDQGRDLKLLTVPLPDPTWNHIHNLGQLPAGFLREVEHFFVVYKELEDETVSVDGWANAAAGWAALDDARTRFSAAH
jgi:inorganic pyrophosphatase